MIKVVLIGSGNIGHYFYNKFKNINTINLVEWYSKSSKKNNLGIEIKKLDNIKKLPEADIFIISVSDSNLKNVIYKLKVKKSIIIHTSGFIDIKVLNRFKNFGVLYPLQTITKNHKIINNSFPFLIESNNKKTKEFLEKFSSILKINYHYLNSIKRKRIHLAAVFVNNFSNHLFLIGEKICKENNIPFKTLYPLISETFEKIKLFSPKDIQTGPAVRGDIDTILEHIDLLDDPKLKNIYMSLTESIKSENEEKKL